MATTEDDPSCETRFLVERLRTGGLTWARLDLAAYLGYAAALGLTERPGRNPPKTLLELARVFEDLRRAWGEGTYQRALAAAGGAAARRPSEVAALRQFQSAVRTESENAPATIRAGAQVLRFVLRAEPRKVWESIQVGLIPWSLLPTPNPASGRRAA
jgi:hypothetical protein